MGKRNSLAARDTSVGSGGVWGAAWMESASIAPPNTTPTASPVARCAASPPHGFFSTQSSVRPKEQYWSPLMSAISAREGLGPTVLATWSACIAPSWSERAAMNASGAASRPASPIRGPRAFFAVVPTASPTHTTTDQETFCTRSARIGFAPFNVPKPAASATRMTSITRPRSTASHPTCRRARQASNDLFISPSIFSPQGRVYFFLAGGAERAPWSPQRLASLRGARRSGLLGDSNCLGLSSTLNQFRAPRGPMFEHRIQDDQQLPHARREGHLFRFPGGTQALIERPDDRIEARRHQRGHIERRPDLRPAAPDRAFPAPCPAITIQRSHPRQRRDLLAGQGAEFRQIRQQRRRHHRPHAGCAPQERILLAPHGTLPNRVGQVAVRVAQFPLEPGDVRAQTLAHRLGGTPQAVLLRRQHLDELPAACQDGRQRLGLLIRRGAQHRPSGRKATSNCALETSIPTKTCVLIIPSSCVARPCMIRAQRPTQLFGLCSVRA